MFQIRFAQNFSGTGLLHEVRGPRISSALTVCPVGSLQQWSGWPLTRIRRPGKHLALRAHGGEAGIPQGYLVTPFKSPLLLPFPLSLPGNLQRQQ